MYKALQIFKGNLFDLLNINQGEAKAREEIACSKCFASHTDEGYYTGWCQKAKKGCGCKISAKTTLPDIKCPLGVWANDWIKPDVLEALNKENNFIKK